MSRLGRYVNAILTGNNENLPEPRSETERELYEAAMKGMSGGVPFGETTVTLIDNQTIPLDEGMSTLNGFTLEKNGVYTVIYNGTEYADLATNAVEAEGGTAYFIGNASLAGGEDNGLPFIILTQSGITMIADAAMGESCTITIIGNTIEQIDGKYLEPFETITVGKDTLEWDGNTNGLYKPADTEKTQHNMHLVSDAMPTYEELCNGGTVTVVFNGSTYTETLSSSNLTGSGALSDGDYAEEYVFLPNAMGCVIYKPDTVIFGDVIAEKTGIYLAVPTTLQINGYAGFKEKQTKLKQEYLPVDYIKQLIAEVTGTEV